MLLTVILEYWIGRSSDLRGFTGPRIQASPYRVAVTNGEDDVFNDDSDDVEELGDFEDNNNDDDNFEDDDDDLDEDFDEDFEAEEDADDDSDFDDDGDF